MTTIIELIEICPSLDVYPKSENLTIITNRTVTLEEAEEIENTQKDLERGLCDEGIFRETITDEMPANGTTIDTADSLNDTRHHGIFLPITHKVQKPCKIISGWTCPKLGRYAHPTSCQKYIQCSYCGENSVYTCGPGEAFDGRRCANDWSNCGNLKCQYDRELIQDPWNRKGYFVCVKSTQIVKQFKIYRRECPSNYFFDRFGQRCNSLYG